MKTIKLIGALIVAIISCVNFSNCSSDPIVPEITVEMGNENYFTKNMDFDSSAGEKTFSFNSNVEWAISVAPTMNGETWCTVTPSSGKNGSNTVVVKVQENTGYDDRNVVLTLTAGSTLTKTITVTQKQKDAILLTTNKFEVEPQGGKINIEVKANVNYEAIISESCKSWISLASKSRGLATSNITFDIAGTEEYDKREGEIIIKSGELSETVHVYQTGQEILLLTKNEYPVTDKGETIAVEVKSNFTFDVQMPDVDWVVDESKSRGVSSHTLYYTILPNETYDNREAEIIFYDKNSSIKDTLKIIQVQKDAIILNKKNYEVESKGGIIEIDLNANVDFGIEIDRTWVKQIETRALVNHKLFFQIEANPNYDARTAYIVMNSKNKLLSDTVRICQAQKDTIIIEQKIFDIPAIGREFSVNLNSNIDCNLIIPDKFKEWIKVSAETRGLTVNTYSFSVPNNKTDNAKARKGFILIESQLGNDTIFVNQDAPILVEEAGTLRNFIDIENLGSYKTLTLVGELNGTDVFFIRKMKNLLHIDIEDCSIVEGGNVYEYDYKTTENTIGRYMFFDLPIEAILLPKNIVEIDGWAFYDCANLKAIAIPEGVKKIGLQAFCGCNSLQEITLPESLIEFETNFSYCKFETIIIPRNVAKLGSHMFIDCRNLREIHIKSVPEVLTDIPTNILYEKDYERITLYIPKGTKDTYMATGLGNFTNIIEE